MSKKLYEKRLLAIKTKSKMERKFCEKCFINTGGYEKRFRNTAENAPKF